MHYVDSGIPPVFISPEDIAPIVGSITANIGVLLPIVFGLAAVFFGIKVVPRLITRLICF